MFSAAGTSANCGSANVLRMISPLLPAGDYTGRPMLRVDGVLEILALRPAVGLHRALVVMTQPHKAVDQQRDDDQRQQPCRAGAPIASLLYSAPLPGGLNGVLFLEHAS